MVSAWFQDCFVVPAPAPAGKRLLGLRLPMVSTGGTPIFRFSVSADIDGSGIGWFAIWAAMSTQRQRTGNRPATHPMQQPAADKFPARRFPIQHEIKKLREELSRIASKCSALTRAANPSKTDLLLSERKQGSHSHRRPPVGIARTHRGEEWRNPGISPSCL